MSSKIRLKDIAETLGLSVATVSRVLNNNDSISEKTRNIVLNKVKELGYESITTSIANVRKDSINIAVLCPYDVFFENIVNGMKFALEELKWHFVNIEYKFIDFYDIVEQTKLLRDISIDGRFDAVAIAPSHSLMLNPLINEIVDCGKKVITFNTDAPTSKRAYYIGQNATVASRMAAQLLGSQLREGEEAAVLTSFAITSGLKERTDSFFDFIIKNYPSMKAIGPFEFHDNIDAAKSIAEQVILLNKNVKALFSNNMVGTIGCARAIKETGNTGKIFVVGFDNNEEIEQYINDDIIFATILQEPFNQGYLTIKTLLKWLVEDTKIENEYLYTKCDLLMKSNLDLQKNSRQNI